MLPAFLLTTFIRHVGLFVDIMSLDSFLVSFVEIIYSRFFILNSMPEHMIRTD